MDKDSIICESSTSLSKAICYIWGVSQSFISVQYAEICMLDVGDTNYFWRVEDGLRISKNAQFFMETSEAVCLLMETQVSNNLLHADIHMYTSMCTKRYLNIHYVSITSAHKKKSKKMTSSLKTVSVVPCSTSQLRVSATDDWINSQLWMLLIIHLPAVTVMSRG